MKEKIEQSLAAHKAKEINDRAIIEAIISLQHSLTTKQRLILKVHTAPLGATYSSAKDESVAVAEEEPRNFSDRFTEINQAPVVKVEGFTKDGKLPPVMEIVIPDNRYPKESSDELGLNTSASRAAVLSGDLRRYLKSDHYRGELYYLEIKPTGSLLDPSLILHPSNIHEIKIETVENESRLGEPVIFRAAA